jgi:hypothetical protein
MMLEMEIEAEVGGGRKYQVRKEKDVGGEMRLCYGCGVSSSKSS